MASKTICEPKKEAMMEHRSLGKRPPSMTKAHAKKTSMKKGG